jgi:hypothetical protein
MIYTAYLFNIQPVCLLSIVHQGTSFISILHIYTAEMPSSPHTASMSGGRSAAAISVVGRGTYVLMRWWLISVKRVAGTGDKEPLWTERTNLLTRAAAHRAVCDERWRRGRSRARRHRVLNVCEIGSLL